MKFASVESTQRLNESTTKIDFFTLYLIYLGYNYQIFLGMAKKYVSKITLAHGGAILDKGEKIGEKLSEMIESAHKAGDNEKETALLNFRSQLRPGNVPEEIQIDPEQVLMVPFRMISATTVGAGTWKATTFPEEVLRESMPLLMNKPIYRDHMMYPDYWLGIVMELAWARESNQGNIIVPPGIDGMFAIDTSTQKNADLAKGIVMGAVRSNSVTVEFEWEPSHDFEYEWQFWDALGTEVNGELVTRIVTRILDYHETSIVGLGADPFAKQIDENGELIDIDLANSEPLGVRTYNNEGEKAQFRKVLKNKAKFTLLMNKDNILNLSKTDKNVAKKNKEKREFATGFGAGLNEAIEALMESQGLKRGDVKQKLADAVGVKVRTVELYVSGKNDCPKLKYIKEWATILEIEPKEMLKLAQEDGCTYSNDELQEVFGESFANPDNDDDNDDDYGDGEGDDNDDDDTMGINKDLVEQMENQIAAFQKQLEELKAGATPKNNKTKQTATNQTPTTVEEYKALLETYKTDLDKSKQELAAQVEKFEQKEETHLNELKEKEQEVFKYKNEAVEILKEKADLEAQVKEMEDLKAKLEASQKSANELTELVSKFKDKEHLTKIGEDYMDSMKKEAIRLYRATFGNDAKDAVINLFDKAETMETLNGLVEQYGKQLTAEFQHHCKSCGSKEIEWGSVIANMDSDVMQNNAVVKTDDQIRDEMLYGNK